MKYRISCIIIFLLIFANIFAQDSDFKFKNGKYNETNLSYWQQIGSQTITNDFLYKINSGGFINSDLKQKNLNRLKSQNIIGLSYSVQANFMQLKSDFFNFKNAGFNIGFDYDAITEARFSKDLFTFVLFGNKSLENSQVSLKNDGYRNLEFGTIKFGLRKLSNNSNHLFGVDLGFVSAFRFGKIEFDNFSLSFTQDFENMYSRGGINIEIADTAHFNKYNPKAFGASLGLNYRYQKEDKTRIEIQIRNAGILWHNKKSFQFSRNITVDSSIVEVPNILNTTNPYKTTSIQDSLTKSLFLNTEAANFHSYLPLEINLLWEQKYTSKWKTVFAFKHRFFSYFKPYYFAQLKFQATKKLAFGPSISYGGYSSLSGGFYLDAEFFKGMFLKIGTDYLTNIIFSTKTSAGIGGFATFTYKF